MFSECIILLYVWYEGRMRGFQRMAHFYAPASSMLWHCYHILLPSHLLPSYLLHSHLLSSHLNTYGPGFTNTDYHIILLGHWFSIFITFGSALHFTATYIGYNPMLWSNNMTPWSGTFYWQSYGPGLCMRVCGSYPFWLYTLWIHYVFRHSIVGL